MEEQLVQLIDEHTQLFDVASLDTILRPESTFVENTWDGLPNTSRNSLISHRSVIVDNMEDGRKMRLISDGATRFLHHQIVEVANGVFSLLISSLVESHLQLLEKNRVKVE